MALAFLSLVSEGCGLKSTPHTSHESAASCISSGTTFRANFSNPDVVAIASKLRLLIPQGGIYSRFSSKDQSSDQQVANFLNQVCREYIDSPAQLNAKFKLLRELHILNEAQPQRDALSCWASISGQQYRKLVDLFAALARFRSGPRFPFKVSHLPEPISICEGKYIFRNYVDNVQASLSSFEEYQRYEKSLKDFLVGTECTQDDRDTLYVFRGDGFLRPLSPEGRSMESVSADYARLCQANRRSMLSLAEIAQCQHYKTHPFATRRAVSLQGLRRLLFYPESQHKIMSDPERDVLFDWKSLEDENAPAFLLDENEDQGKVAAGLSRVLQMRGAVDFPVATTRELGKQLREVLDGTTAKGIQRTNDWLWDRTFENLPDQGLAKLFPVMQPQNKNTIERRLSAVFERAAHFYRTAAINSQGTVYAAYSPWVSSSYYLHQSHRFTFQGFARGVPSERRMYWMYIFKIKRADYFKKSDVAAGKTIDFNRQWFDEASFTQHPFSVQEMTWDRFAAVDPGEFEALLYLGNVKSDEGLNKRVGFLPGDKIE